MRMTSSLGPTWPRAQESFEHLLNACARAALVLGRVQKGVL